MILSLLIAVVAMTQVPSDQAPPFESQHRHPPAVVPADIPPVLPPADNVPPSLPINPMPAPPSKVIPVPVGPSPQATAQGFVPATAGFSYSYSTQSASYGACSAAQSVSYGACSSAPMQSYTTVTKTKIKRAWRPFARRRAYASGGCS